MTGALSHDHGDYLDQGGFVAGAVVPDGTGGWQVVSLGEPFKRTVTCESTGAVNTGRLMRAVKTRGRELASRDTAPEAGAGTPRLLLVNIDCPNHYGVKLLVERLRDSGIEAASVYLPHRGYIPEFDTAVRTSPVPDPNIVGIAVDSARVDDVIELVKVVRRCRRDAFVLIGGPETQHGEHLAVVLDDFDVLVKGQAVGVIEDLARIIGGARRGAGLSPAQLERLGSLRGGIVARGVGTLLYNNLAHTNMPERFQLLRPDRRAQVHYLHTSIGCPRGCRFCYRWSGRGYHMALPADEAPGEETRPRYERSARAMKEWLVGRLEMGGPTGERIRLLFTDDDFLVSRRRVEALHRLVAAMDLPKHFELACFSSVSSFLRGGAVDREIIEWMRALGFGDVYLGTDGLCDRVLEANRKGYSLEQAILANRALIEGGLRPQHNIIWSTPFTTEAEITESLLLFHLLPFSFNPVQTAAIGAELGTAYTNEYVVRHSDRYIWPDVRSEAPGFDIHQGWRVPRGFPEYAVVVSERCRLDTEDDRALRILCAIEREADVSLERLVREGAVDPEVVNAVASHWLSSPSREIASLGQVVRAWRIRTGSDETWPVVEKVRRDMLRHGMLSFEEYLRWLRQGAWNRAVVPASLPLAAEPPTDGGRAWPLDPIPELDRIGALIDRERYREAVRAWSDARCVAGRTRRHMEYLRVLTGRHHLARAFQRARLAFLDTRDGYHQRPVVLYLVYSLLEAIEGVAPVDEVDFRLSDLGAASKWWDLLDELNFTRIDVAARTDGSRVACELLASERSAFLGVPLGMQQTDGRTRLTLDLDNLGAPPEERRSSPN